ncbi:DUF4873 domain-containing protein [Tsukamurella soli]|uniref:DUF4873 domain-containing protein n=1 Tax=Tsukamurella soli TaxID=644556 RepID=A0ABP8K9H5_9ACTN
MTRLLVVTRGRAPDLAGHAATVVDPVAAGSLAFDPGSDTWSWSGGTAAAVLVCGAEVAVGVPRISGQPAAPGTVGPGAADAYLGVLVDGVPNVFVVDPADTARLGFVHTCLAWMAAEGATRITSRPAVTADRGVLAHTERRLRRPVREEVDLSDAYLRDDGVWAGPARLAAGATERTAPVRLAGHFEPLDGRYHWYGTIDDPAVGAEFKAFKRGTVTLAVDGCPAVSAAVTDRTGWGTYRVEGIGAPPFPMAG